MKKKFLLVAILVFTNIVFSQDDTCSSSEEGPLVDLNTITKCTVEPSKNSKSKGVREISVRIVAPKRFLKKRLESRKSAASSLDNLESSGLSSTNKKSELTKSLALKSNVANITDRLSAEQIRKADKFGTVDQIPSFSDCNTIDSNERMNCFNTEMIKHIQEYFHYPSQAVIDKVEGDVWVRFIIDENGDVTNIKALGPRGAKILNTEAIRVVSLLPKFSPALKKGKNVPVKYGFPISFSLNEK